MEDVGAPSLVRTVGRVLEVFPDGTSRLQLQRPPEGTFGFCVAYGSGRRDSGMLLGIISKELGCVCGQVPSRPWLSNGKTFPSSLQKLFLGARSQKPPLLSGWSWQI